MSELKKIPVILDGDPGHDDAIGWTLAQGSGRFNILAVTSCSGNVGIEKTTYNTLRVCTLLGIDAPIAEGCPHPLTADVMNAPSVHGESGLDGPALPEPAMEVCGLTAVELMAKVLRESPEPVTIIPTGPETNVAALLLAHPELKSKIKQISLMGGGIAYGNWTPAAEFNIYADPDAAQIVFKSGVPIVMCGLDVTLQAVLTPEDWDELAATGTPAGVFTKACLQKAWSFLQPIGFAGVAMHDTCPVMYLAHPELFRAEEAGVYVETRGSITRGKTVTDLYSDKQFETKNARVVLGVDRDRFIAIVKDCIKTI